MIEVRELKKEEVSGALSLSLKVFLECNFADYNKEGVELIKKFINDNKIVNLLTIYGALENGELIGIIGVKNFGAHISLFFVDKKAQGRGVGRSLFEFFIEDTKTSHITVSSSTYAVEIYKKMGFVQLGKQETQNGLTFVLMEYKSYQNIGALSPK